ncbi:MAG: L-seryl-tRNA(Sec) selenium transferase, partial [Candidatus Desulforudis sp.]|nr:L-seryl-tRNA(Sec) selenium transferase [Desulforudis sp.]
VINATGVVLHTNLGRAILSERARRAVETAAASYTNLEFNLETGKRGSRYALVDELLQHLSGAEASLVVNNNAAAVLLALSTLAGGREVIVSRGQLVEIGGSFRIPEVMAQSGARLVEVGTTNKTHRRDYEGAIGPDTALLLHVHASNYRIVGFTKEVTLDELVGLGREAGLPVMSDLGSGFLVDLSRFGYPYEPTVQETVGAGVDVVTFSGDKLLGGPQAGIIVGRADLVDRMKRNPLTRAVRVDKMTLAALEATLREYLEPEQAMERIPTLAMLTAAPAVLEEKAERLAGALLTALGEAAEVEVDADCSQVGGGALPTAAPQTFLVVIRPRAMSVPDLVCRLRAGDPAVVGRVQDDRLCLDPRTVAEEEFTVLGTALGRALGVVGG